MDKQRIEQTLKYLDDCVLEEGIPEHPEVFLINVFMMKHILKLLLDEPKPEVSKPTESIYCCCWQSGGADKCPIHSSKATPKLEGLEEVIKDVGVNLVDEYFPKGECKERGQAIVLYAELLIAFQEAISRFILDRAPKEYAKEDMSEQSTLIDERKIWMKGWNTCHADFLRALGVSDETK